MKKGRFDEELVAKVKLVVKMVLVFDALLNSRLNHLLNTGISTKMVCSF